MGSTQSVSIHRAARRRSTHWRTSQIALGTSHSAVRAPPNSLVVGSPIKVLRPVNEKPWRGSTEPGGITLIGRGSTGRSVSNLAGADLYFGYLTPRTMCTALDTLFVKELALLLNRAVNHCPRLSARKRITGPRPSRSRYGGRS